MPESERYARYLVGALILCAAFAALCAIQRDWAGIAVLLLFALADAGVLIARSVRKRRDDEAPRVAARAVVKGRYEDRSIQEKGASVRFFYIVFRLEKGEEKCFEVSPADYQRLKRGDEGELIYQGEQLLAFEPDGVRLMPELEEE